MYVGKPLCDPHLQSYLRSNMLKMVAGGPGELGKLSNMARGLGLGLTRYFGAGRIEMIRHTSCLPRRLSSYFHFASALANIDIERASS